MASFDAFLVVFYVI